jgi:predicted RNA binding protein YcfA (HicA-like mRNA interferase family)
MTSNLYPDLIITRLLIESGCKFLRQGGKGSHEVWYSPITARKFTIPRNTKMVHTANAILKSAGLPKAF